MANTAGHPHIRNLVERTLWTDEKTLEDGIGECISCPTGLRCRPQRETRKKSPLACGGVDRSSQFRELAVKTLTTQRWYSEANDKHVKHTAPLKLATAHSYAVWS